MRKKTCDLEISSNYLIYAERIHKKQGKSD